jgi:DNA polymerase I-like protein with 3'-5' exonuclease and polymerase domains
VRHFIEGRKIWFDVESTGLDLWHGDTPFAFSFCNQWGETRYFEWDVDPFERRVIPVQEELEMMRDLLEDPDIEKEGHNVKFDVRAMENVKIKVRGKIGETLVKAHNCNSQEYDYGAKPLAKKYGIMDDSDERIIKKRVQTLRNRAKKLGWKTAFTERINVLGELKRKASVPADYWIPRMMWKLHPELTEDTDYYLCEEYATNDARRAMFLGLFYDRIIDREGCRDVYEMETRLWPRIYEMEAVGVRIDPKALKQSMDDEIARVRPLFDTLEKYAWKGFNPNSSKQMLEFAAKLGTEPPMVKRKNGKYTPSTGKEFLRAHFSNPAINTLARFRASMKAFGSFFAKFDKCMVKEKRVTHRGQKIIHESTDFVIHASFQQTGASTGRLSCRDPNLQNVTEPEGSESLVPTYSRHIFIPRPGYAWLCVDYSNMEVRVLGYVAQDPVLMGAINRGEDIHSVVANQVFGGYGNSMAIWQARKCLNLDGIGIMNDAIRALWKRWGIADARKLTEQNRRDICENWLNPFEWDIVKAQKSVDRKYARAVCKNLTFLKVYGGGISAARKKLIDEKGQPLPDDEIYTCLDAYDERIPRVREYTQEIIEQGKIDGYVKTLWGRKLAVEYDKEYRGVNYIVQGSCADLIKSRMIAVHEYFRYHRFDARTLITVHDELDIETNRNILTLAFVRNVCKIMEQSDGHIPIKMPVEPSIAWNNWSKKEKLKLAA